MTSQILFFSTLKDCVGTGEMTWPLDTPVAVGELYSKLSEKFPPLAKWRPSLLMAINQAYVSADALVSPGDEVAFMPPVQGG
jgi:molybdopterin converting factor subunit 1